MAYNKKNYYKTVIAIQNKVLELQQADGDLSLKEIYWQHVHGKMAFISYRTFSNYLGVPAKRELKELLDQEELKLLNINQLTLF